MHRRNAFLSALLTSTVLFLTKTNVKSLKLACAVALGGTSTNENLQST
jgi:hypothetical protein